MFWVRHSADAESVEMLNRSVTAPNGNRYGWPVFSVATDGTLVSDKELTDTQRGYVDGFLTYRYMVKG